MTATDPAPPIGITEMAQRCGLSPDTLRWYEKEGVLPRVARAPDGRRSYRDADRRLIGLLIALRDTGMSTAQMKEFVALVSEGAASHGRRISLLDAVRAQLDERRAAIDRAQAALDEKVAHYERLIAAGLDCEGDPVPAAERARQADRHIPQEDA